MVKDDFEGKTKGSQEYGGGPWDKGIRGLAKEGRYSFLGTRAYERLQQMEKFS